MRKEGSLQPPGRVQGRIVLILLLIALAGSVPAQVPEDQRTNQQTGVWVFDTEGQASSPERALADQALARRIKARMESDPWVLSYQVAVAVRHGMVTLSGKVETLLAKERAAELVRTIPDARAIQNQLQVVLPWRPDLEVRNEIVAWFAHHPPLQSCQAMVEVLDGFALLSGSVDSEYRKQLAKQVAKSVPGVRAVENKLQVNHLAQRSDQDIQADVASRLQWDPWLENPQISVQVTNGTAALAGVVESQSAKAHAIQAAQLPGVKAVDASQLHILDQTTSSILKGSESF